LDLTGLQVKYSEAAEAAPPGAKEVAVYFANRAACQLKLRQWGPAASDCTRALEVDPAYLKALLRRCTANEELDDLEKALTDAKKVRVPRDHAVPYYSYAPRTVYSLACLSAGAAGSHIFIGLCVQVLELDPGNAAMSGKVRRLEPIVAERREKMKDEMMGACCISVVVACEAHAVHLLELLCVFRRQAQGAGQHRAGQVRHVVGQLQSREGSEHRQLLDPVQTERMTTPHAVVSCGIEGSLGLMLYQ